MSRLFEGTSFDRPRVCETCGKAVADCRCLHLPEKKKMSAGKPAKRAGDALDSGLVLTPENSKPPADQVVKVRIEKRKGGRSVTVVSGMEHPGNDVAMLCTKLRQSLATGGSVQGRTVELQGEHSQRVVALLMEMGMKAKTA